MKRFEHKLSQKYPTRSFHFQKSCFFLSVEIKYYTASNLSFERSFNLFLSIFKAVINFYRAASLSWQTEKIFLHPHSKRRQHLSNKSERSQKITADFQSWIVKKRLEIIIKGNREWHTGKESPHYAWNLTNLRELISTGINKMMLSSDK